MASQLVPVLGCSGAVLSAAKVAVAPARMHHGAKHMLTWVLLKSGVWQQWEGLPGREALLVEQDVVLWNSE